MQPLVAPVCLRVFAGNRAGEPDAWRNLRWSRV
jgi:hypothetical protein